MKKWFIILLLMLVCVGTWYFLPYFHRSFSQQVIRGALYKDPDQCIAGSGQLKCREQVIPHLFFLRPLSCVAYAEDRQLYEGCVHLSEENLILNGYGVDTGVFCTDDGRERCSLIKTIQLAVSNNDLLPCNKLSSASKSWCEELVLFKKEISSDTKNLIDCDKYSASSVQKTICWQKNIFKNGSAQICSRSSNPLFCYIVAAKVLPLDKLCQQSELSGVYAEACRDSIKSNSSKTTESKSDEIFFEHSTDNQPLKPETIEVEKVALSVNQNNFSGLKTGYFQFQVHQSKKTGLVLPHASSVGSDLTVYRSYGLGVGDINSDGKLDLVVGSQHGLAIFKNMGALSFKKIDLGDHLQWINDVEAISPIIEDFDRDGFEDVFFGVPNGQLEILWGSSSGFKEASSLDCQLSGDKSFFKFAFPFEIQGRGRTDLLAVFSVFNQNPYPNIQDRFCGLINIKDRKFKRIAIEQAGYDRFFDFGLFNSIIEVEPDSSKRFLVVGSKIPFFLQVVSNSENQFSILMQDLERNEAAFSSQSVDVIDSPLEKENIYYVPDVGSSRVGIPVSTCLFVGEDQREACKNTLKKHREKLQDTSNNLCAIFKNLNFLELNLCLMNNYSSLRLISKPTISPTVDGKTSAGVTLGKRQLLSNKTHDLGLPNSFGSVRIEDLNSDGYQDVAVLGQSFINFFPLQYFQNNGSNHFADKSLASFDLPLNVGTSMLIEDFDNDGDLDIFTIGSVAEPIIAENKITNSTLQVSVKDWSAVEGNELIRVIVYPPKGQPVIKTLRKGGGNLSQKSSILYFGLGPFQFAKKIQIRWRNGSISTFDGPFAVNERLMITKKGNKIDTK